MSVVGSCLFANTGSPGLFVISRATVVFIMRGKAEDGHMDRARNDEVEAPCSFGKNERHDAFQHLKSYGLS